MGVSTIDSYVDKSLIHIYLYIYVCGNVLGCSKCGGSPQLIDNFVFK